MASKEAFCEQIMPVYRTKLKEIEEQIALLSSIKSNLEERITYLLEENPKLKEEMNHER
ncbi:hypothetical protein D3C76_1793930 [compost metagenome]